MAGEAKTLTVQEFDGLVAIINRSPFTLVTEMPFLQAVMDKIAPKAAPAADVPAHHEAAPAADVPAHHEEPTL